MAEQLCSAMVDAKRVWYIEILFRAATLIRYATSAAQKVKRQGCFGFTMIAPAFLPAPKATM